jgi:enhancing lycopene biosynthesis protein 2
MSANVLVVLSGCGVFDGSEIQEAVSCLVALDRRGAKVTCAAPNAKLKTIDHAAQKPDGTERDVLTESARIARGKIVELSKVHARDFDAVVFPGGFGAAKNLCNFAEKGPECEVHPEVQRIIHDFHAAGKPIGLACIAPVLAAKVLGKSGKSPKLTIGSDPQTASAVTKMGATHQNTTGSEICVDAANRIVTTPCYMLDVGPAVVFAGAEKMVEATLKLVGTR